MINVRRFALNPARNGFGDNTRCLVTVALLLLAPTGCSGSSTSSPTAPGTGGSSGGQTCRNYAAAATQVNVGPQLASTVSMTCTYNASTFQLTCPFTYADSQGTTNTFVQVFSYSSTADFVDEVRVIPPLTRWTGTSITVSGVTSTQTNLFDGQRRWIQNVATTPGAAPVTTTYTAWDSAGRPTTGSLSTAAGLTTIGISSNDAARTDTTTKSTSGFPTFVSVTTYDANGNLAQLVSTNGGSVVQTSTWTIASTVSVCK